MITTILTVALTLAAAPSAPTMRLTARTIVLARKRQPRRPPTITPNMLRTAFTCRSARFAASKSKVGPVRIIICAPGNRATIKNALAATRAHC